MVYPRSTLICVKIRVVTQSLPQVALTGESLTAPLGQTGMSVLLTRDDVLNTAIAQQLVECVEVLAQDLVQAPAVSGKLVLE